MKKIEINVTDRGSAYNRQIVAGFTILGKEGRLRPVFHEKPELRKSLCTEIEVLADGKRIAYDLTDGYNNYPTFADYDKSLEDVDICFKASVREEFHEGMKNRDKVKVLAPRYAGTCKGSWNDKIDLSKSRGIALAKELLWRVPGTKHAVSDYYYDRFEQQPRIIAAEPKVFFYTRLWNPAVASPESSQNRDLDGETVEERIAKKNQEYSELSALRAGLVRALKKEFGKNFVGGIAPDDYTTKAYPNLLGPDLSRRSTYTKSMHLAEICVNTWGTHKCYNFSFGEELAGARAIVTQAPFYKIPDYLTVGTNFLTYETIDDCLEKTVALYKDKQAIEQMMRANYEYYQQHLRPDCLVLDTLKVAGVEL